MKSILVILVIVLVIAAGTRPDETKMASTIGKKSGALSDVAAVLGHITGVAPLAYHNYFFFSTETQGSKTIGVGLFGQVILMEQKRE